ncbi:MAG: S-methyl-5-thioribose-1-phosphate isomerase [Candidatus Altiarchaeales archaeon ex4484_96]|nr:MAG: S-methyl-5-thioribose-1-phosphate isomerase [Candidatus Altiarchaeales archaeon ex4484_96]
MKVKVDGKLRDYPTVWMQNDVVCMINQPALPHSFEIIRSRDYVKTAECISNMTVRGAPAIGATAAYGLSQAILHYGGGFDEIGDYLNQVIHVFSNTRPTAYDLFHSLEHIRMKVSSSGSVSQAKKTAVDESAKYAVESAKRCAKIGKIGDKLIKDNMRILTHCNAGALACVDHGTALAPMRAAHKNKKKIHVYVDETRPRMQGSRLTAWELAQEDISHSIIADNAAGYFMSRGEIDLVLVGADRIALNGDVANKIGTYEKAVLAKENNIPFYVAAPSSTIDHSTKSGKDIQIEERDPLEVLGMWGYDSGGEIIRRFSVSPQGSKGRNPAFDITPSEYITGIITENGLHKPKDIIGLE